MSTHTGLTLLTHTELGNLVFQANDDTVYVCREAMHGAEVWKSNHGGYLNTAGTLSTNHNGLGLDKTACRCCGHACICPECRCTDLELETDFQTAFLGMNRENLAKAVAGAKKYAGIAAAGAKTVGKAGLADGKAGVKSWQDHKASKTQPDLPSQPERDAKQIQPERNAQQIQLEQKFKRNKQKFKWHKQKLWSLRKS